MTRKCALCKESNYKNVYSFFSAPKDPIMRKCWEDALSMDVTDDTFICSKHFHQEDIITHWVSGQPPHVITIKYKKCRLRPSAVPIIGIEFQNNIQNTYIEEEDDTFELRVNRNDSSVSQSNNGETEENRANPHYELSYSQGKKKCRVKEKEKDHDKNFRIFISCDDNYVETLDASSVGIKEEQLELQEETFLIPREDVNVLIQDESGDYDGAVRDYILRTEQKKKSMQQNKNMQNNDESGNVKTKVKVYENESKENTTEIVDNRIISEDHIYLSNEILNTDHEDQTVEVWETNTLEDMTNVNEQTTETITIENCKLDSMLFEDFLEVCTEANLPKGWLANVIPKGHETTIVYSFTSTTNSAIPFVEKQVYLKSDMILHFGTSNIEIDPFEHNLIKDKQDFRISALTDIEDIIEEFDQRRVCEGINDDLILEYINLYSMALKEGSKWRHVECSVLMDDDETICSRCNLLTEMNNSTIINILNSKVHESSDLENGDNFNLDSEYENSTEFEINTSSNVMNLITAIDALNIPEIQKVMMKECLKTSNEVDGQKSIKFSKTWIFLCILLYRESPRMYRYLEVNHYLSLPSLITIQHYLHRIKTEPRFYSYFQQSIEPFRLKEKDNGKIRSEKI